MPLETEWPLEISVWHYSWGSCVPGSVAIEDDKVSSPELVHLVTCCVIQASHLSLAGQSCTKDTSRNILRLFR